MKMKTLPLMSLLALFIAPPALPAQPAADPRHDAGKKESANWIPLKNGPGIPGGRGSLDEERRSRRSMSPAKEKLT